MRKFEREPEPEILLQHAAQWTARWVARRKQSPGAQFDWPEIEGVPLNQHLLPVLRSQTQDHCSFCDGYPVAASSTETIEHFHSKTRHPEHAFRWNFLYYACTTCQGSKRDAPSAALLQPDAPDYEFLDWFYWDMESGELLPNPRRGPECEERARQTCEAYGLNGHDRPFQRKLQRRRWLKRSESDGEIDLWPYREFLQAG